MKRVIPPVCNSQVALRLVEDRDLPLTLAWRNRDEARKNFKNSEIISPDQHLSWFKRYLARDDDFVFIVEAENMAVGQAAVYGIDWNSGTAEIGRFLAAPEHSGKGYIRAGCELMIDLCWEKLDLKYLFLEVFEHNTRAIRLYESVGFVKEPGIDNLLRFGFKRE
jgi:diamine N-acetyltransferase